MWENKHKQGIDEWWQGINMTDKFNKRCNKVILHQGEIGRQINVCTSSTHNKAWWMVSPFARVSQA
jgi:hypothetical protein